MTLNGQARVFPLPPLGVCQIGRGSDNGIVLDDPVASRAHAMIHRDAANRCQLSDAGSSNGTSVNDRPVTRSVALADNDVILIGSHRLIFRCTQPATAAAANSEASTHFMSRQRLVSVLVADVRGYTALSRELGETRIAAVMQRFFGEAGTMLDRRGAWAQKYIGDAVMVVWAHAGDQVANAELINILGAVADLRAIAHGVSEALSLPRPLIFGGGINTGFAAIGNMGSTALNDFTALGDTVNKAFRFETASKDTGCGLVIGRATLDYLTSPVADADRPPASTITLKGYDEQASVFAIGFEMLPRLAASLTPAGRTTLIR